VIRRRCKAPKDSDEQVLRALGQKTAQDEGYESEPAQVSVRRS